MAEHRTPSGIRPAVVAAIGAACMLVPITGEGHAAAGLRGDSPSSLPSPAVAAGAARGSSVGSPEQAATTPAIDPRVARAVRAGDAEFLVVLERNGGNVAPGVQEDARAASVAAMAADLAPRMRALERIVEPLASGGHVAESEQFPLLGVLAVTGDETSLEAIAGQPGVATVLPNRRHRLETGLSAAAPSGPTEWNLDLLQAERAWREIGANGQGVVVATIDSGADWLHPALRSRYRGRGGWHDYAWLDASRPDSPRDRPSDGNGHGTQVLGVIVGGDVDGAPLGVAPGAEWISVRAFDSYGFSTDRRLLRAAEWILAPTKTDGTAPRADLAPDVVNCSWVLENGADPLFDAVIRAWRAAGILPVFAAGNSDDGTRTRAGILAPASSPDVIAVGALRPSGQVWELSKGGPSFHGATKPDVVAPGVGILTARSGGGTTYGTGTSMAAPHAAAIAALMLSADPGLGVSDVAYGLRSTATDLAPSGPDDASGFGVADALRAAEWSMRSGRISGAVTDLDGTPVPGAAVRLVASPPREGASRSAVTDEDGSYSVAVAPGGWTVTASTHRHTDGQGWIEAVPEATAALDLRLSPLPLRAVTGQVSGVFGEPLAHATVDLLVPDGPEVPGAGGLGVVRLASTGADGRYGLSLPAGTHELRFGAVGHRSTAESVLIGSQAVVDVSLAAAPTLLLVDADAHTGERIHPYIVSAVARFGYDLDVWQIDDPLSDVPGLEDLARYDVVIWPHVFGSPGRLDARRRDRAASLALEAYVAGGGRLIISGQDIGRHDSDDTPLAGAAAPRLFAEVLGGRFVADDAAADHVQGVGWLDGLELALDSPGGRDKGRRHAPDVVAPVSDAHGGRIVPLLQYPDGRAAALATSSPGGRRVYLAFGPEGVGDRNSLGDLYDRLVGWLETPWIVLSAEPRTVSTGDTSRLGVTVRAGRAAAPAELELGVPPAWSIAAFPRDMESADDDHVLWAGVVESSTSRYFEVDALLVGPVAGAQPQVVTSTLRSLGRTQVVTTALGAVAPDLDASTASVAPARIPDRASVDYQLAIANSGGAGTGDAEARIKLPAGSAAVTSTLRASTGAVAWGADGRNAVWHGVLAPTETSELRFAAVVSGTQGTTHEFAAEINDGFGRLITRTASVLVGGPDLGASAALPLPAVVLAGTAFDLSVELVNGGAATALATTTIDLPPGIETGAATGSGIERQDLVEPLSTVQVTVPLGVSAGAGSGPRAIGITIDDGAEPRRPLQLTAETLVRRAELEGSRTILLPSRVRSGDVLTATVLVSNQGDATVPVSVIDSLPPALVIEPESARASGGDVVVEPGTVRWAVDAQSAGDDYSWSQVPLPPAKPGVPVAYEIQEHTAARGPVSLGFGFPFYTDVYTQAWVSDDGLLSFTPPRAGRAPTLGPGGPDAPSVAALWRPATRGARPSLRREPGQASFSWPARAGGDIVGVTLEQSGAIRMTFGAPADLAGSAIGLRAPDGHVLNVPTSEVSSGWGLSFDPPGGWEWMSFSGRLGHAMPPNRPVTHTVQLSAAGYEQTMNSGVLANELRLDASSLVAAPRTPVPGGAVRYSLAVSPVGDVAARDVEVRIEPPATGTIDRESLTGGLQPGAGNDELTWRGRVEAGETHLLGWALRLPDDVRVGARLTARASLRAAGVPAMTLSSVVRVRSTDFSGSEKRATCSVARPGELIGFTLRAANSGSEPANVRLTDSLPAGLRYVDGSARSSIGPAPEWNPDTRALTWQGTVQGGSFASVYLEAVFEGTGPATNAMWLTDDAGTTFADWADVVPVAHSVHLPRVLRDTARQLPVGAAPERAGKRPPLPAVTPASVIRQ